MHGNAKRAPGRTRRPGDAGQGTVEFALAFPFQLLMALGVLQLALVSVGAAFTKYAAFCAARAALIRPEHRGRVDPSRAARIALLPVTGASRALGPLARLPPLPVRIPGTGARIDPARWSAAQVKTRATIRDEGHLVRAQVEHDFELVVPMAGRIFAALSKGGIPYAAPHVRLTDSFTLQRGRTK